jgi:hypothetical protein
MARFCLFWLPETLALPRELEKSKAEEAEEAQLTVVNEHDSLRSPLRDRPEGR